MRIKGYAIVTREQGMLHRLPDDKAGVPMDEATDAELGRPGRHDFILAFTTHDPLFMELVCVADVPASCANIGHLVMHHMEDIEVLLDAFKRKQPKA